MVAALPRPVQLRLEQALAQWRHWRLPGPPRPPEVECALGNGLSNYNLLLRAGEHRLVLRLDRLDPLQHSLNRQAEWRVLQQAHAAGLAPAPRWQHAELGALLCDYLPPDTAPPAEETKALGALLRRIHALPGIHLRLDLGLRLRRYERQTQAASPGRWAALQGLQTSLQRCLQAASAEDGPPRLCHNDLLRANRLHSGGQLYALDWEYAAMGPVWFELAALLAGDDWPAAAEEALLEAWLQRPPSGEEGRQLRRYQVIYRYLELLWHCQPGAEMSTAAWEHRRQQLVTGLAGLSRGSC